MRQQNCKIGDKAHFAGSKPIDSRQLNGLIEYKPMHDKVPISQKDVLIVVNYRGESKFTQNRLLSLFCTCEWLRPA